MCRIFNTLLLISLQATVILSALPPIEKCSMTDSDCLKKSAQNAISVFAQGIPEINVETLEPLHVDYITIDLAGLQLIVNDTEVKGLGKSVVDKVKFDTKKKVLEFSFHIEPLHFKGKYKASGRLLILPISGDGILTINIKNLEIHLTMPYDVVKNENGKDVIELKSYTFTSENKVNTHFKLTNLFNGNKGLSDAMHEFMNGSWGAIYQEFSAPMLKKPLLIIFTAIKNYLRSQPIEDIVNTN